MSERSARTLARHCSMARATAAVVLMSAVPVMPAQMRLFRRSTQAGARATPLFSSDAPHSAGGAVSADASTGLASSDASCAGSSEASAFISGRSSPNHFTFFRM